MALAGLVQGCCSTDPKPDWLSDARHKFQSGGTGIDIDQDGIAELHIVARLPNGSPKQEQIDYDENGTVDAWINRDAKGWTYISDLDHNGSPDKVRHVSNLPDGSFIDVIVLDSNHDGILDERITSREAATTIERTVELYVDGKFWPLRLDSTAKTKAYAYSTSYSGPSGPLTIDTNCGANGAKILDAYAKGLSIGRDCLGEISPTLPTDFETAMYARSVTEISCESIGGGDDGYAPNFDDASGTKPLRILIDPSSPDAFTPALFFHEALHYALGGHHDGNPESDPLDQIYGCGRYCFKGKTADDCEACLGESAGSTTDECAEKSDFHPCSNAPAVRCFNCADMEYSESEAKNGKRCGSCGGKQLLMAAGELCCDGIVCPSGSICGSCGGKGFCSSVADPQYCGDCGGTPTVMPTGAQCCPPDNANWNADRMQCEANCPGGSAAGGDAGVVRNFELGHSKGSFEFSWNTYTIKDRLILRYDGSVLYDTGCVGESSSVRLDYSGKPTFISVEVIPDCAGETDTVWDFQVSCP